jgi:hypothetical protein
MIIFYSGLIVVGLALSIYHWFFLQEVETANIRIGLTLPKKALLLFRGVFFACLFASVLTIFATFIAR